MNIKRIIDEDFNNYKLCSMFIAFPNCSWKCGKELCQNSPLASSPTVFCGVDDIYTRYLTNPISQAVVCGGLEPFDSFRDLYMLIVEFRKNGCPDPFVIYTGYNKAEITEQLKFISVFDNIIVKFGRFVPNQEAHYDGILGVNLQSDNQYAEVIS